MPAGFHGYFFGSILAAAKGRLPAVQPRLPHHLRELPRLVYGGEGEDGGREQVSPTLPSRRLYKCSVRTFESLHEIRLPYVLRLGLYKSWLPHAILLGNSPSPTKYQAARAEQDHNRCLARVLPFRLDLRFFASSQVELQGKSLPSRGAGRVDAGWRYLVR